MSEQSNRTDIESLLAGIRQEKADRDAKAAWAQQQQDSRNAALEAAKAVCQAACGPISAALAATDDPQERAALVELESRTHTPHAAALEAAYLTFASQRVGDSNPAVPGAEAPLEAHVAVTSSTDA